MRDLTGKNAIVTGASRGLGRFIALALARRRANVALAARSAGDLEQVRAQAAGLGVRAVAIPTDVADAAQRHRLVERAEAELGPTDILINNAGVEETSDYTDLSEQDIQRHLDINLGAPMLLARAVLPGMLRRRSGHIVNISSLAGKTGTPFGETYSAAKFGLVGFTEALRASYAGSGVGFSVVCPGFVSDEGMFARQIEAGLHGPRALGAVTPEQVASAVIHAIERRRAEVVVNKTPIRPLLALHALIPELDVWFKQRMGVVAYFRDVARLNAAERARGAKG